MAYFSQMREVLALEGGNLLVNVLRDMLAGKVWFAVLRRKHR